MAFSFSRPFLRVASAIQGSPWMSFSSAFSSAATITAMRFLPSSPKVFST